MATVIAERKSGVTLESLVNQYGSVLLLIPILAFFAAFQPRILSANNLMNVGSQLVMLGLLSIGQMFVILTGNFDLSVAGNCVLCSVITALLLNTNIGAVPSMVVGVAVGVVVGMLQGMIATRFCLSTFMVTVASMFLLRGVAFLITDGVAIPTPILYTRLALATVFGIPVIVLFLALCFVMAAVVLARTAFGRNIYAIGSNSVAACRCGINVSRVLLSAMTISGLCSGMAGVILASRLMSGQPNAIRTYDMSSIAAVILGGASVNGGKGTVFGTLIGLLILGFLDNGLGLLRVSPYWQQIAIGATIVFAVFVDSIRTNFLSAKRA
jgi:ribose transport system permease protein